MLSSRASARGFTLVEMLVVIGITALLLGILLPALSGAKRRARKTEEVNRLRQVGLAWTMYANNNKGATLPGYLADDESSSGVQDRWKVKYKFPDKNTVPQEDAASWPWRLMTYLEFDHGIFLGYRGDLEEPGRMSMTYAQGPGDPPVLVDPPYRSGDSGSSDFLNMYGEVPYGQATARPLTIAEQPGFAYNALYVGGWWQMAEVGGQTLPRPRYWDARKIDDEEQKEAVVSRSIGGIRNASGLITFSTSAMRGNGIYEMREEPDDLPGWHYITPPRQDEARMWIAGQRATTSDQAAGPGHGSAASAVDFGDPFQMLVIKESPAPVGRYTGTAAALFVDNHVDLMSPEALMDQRLWIDAADTKDWFHLEGTPLP